MERYLRSKAQRKQQNTVSPDLTTVKYKQFLLVAKIIKQVQPSTLVHFVTDNRTPQQTSLVSRQKCLDVDTLEQEKLPNNPNKCNAQRTARKPPSKTLQKRRKQALSLVDLTNTPWNNKKAENRPESLPVSNTSETPSSPESSARLKVIQERLTSFSNEELARLILLATNELNTRRQESQTSIPQKSVTEISSSTSIDITTLRQEVTKFKVVLANELNKHKIREADAVARDFLATMANAMGKDSPYSRAKERKKETPVFRELDELRNAIKDHLDVLTISSEEQLQAYEIATDLFNTVQDRARKLFKIDDSTTILGFSDLPNGKSTSITPIAQWWDRIKRRQIKRSLGQN